MIILSKKQVISLHSSLVKQFGGLHGIEIFCTNEELIELGFGIASGKIGQEQILNWIIAHDSI